MNRRTRLFIFNTLFLAVFIFLKGFGQAEKAETCINELMQQSKTVGLAVVVVKDNQLIYTHSFGYKDLESQTPLSDKDLFRIASISKSFTATSILQLVEAKKLKLDADVSDLLGIKVRNPLYPDKVITLKMILSHTSSVNDSQGYFTLDAINPDKNPNWAKCYNTYEPGAGYMYCNLNFNMAGTILEKTSGERFDQYVKHHILDPLGLYGGYCVDSLDQSRFATLYEYKADSGKFVAASGAYAARSVEVANYTMGYSTPVFSPTGGMKITATDLAKYMMMHMNQGKFSGKRIIRKKSARLMQSKIAEKEGYGLAIVTTDSLIAGKTMKGHTGSAYGLYSYMFFQPKEKFGFVVITNGYSSSIPGGLKPFVNCLYEYLVKDH
ncbi:class A beta-lactamase-related serine hydrolase [Paraflavitalea soli]|uniref:Class A beta-lactamase-related serine hydrolase n=1 Tax=Paraflavitalea soli TaxID=2315862 RepID=A0A3B7MEV1_9BACT|nr:serine hydrolase domain-containing protein [Paraflavitalea soli]AXY72832.1 class A beta-lactamase-related serine hydrolase [Paraflavitalea soli]